MAGKNIHVVNSNDQWKVKQDGAQRSFGNFGTQKEAFERAREIARRNGQKLQFTERMVKSVRSIATAMILIHLRVNANLWKEELVIGTYKLF